MDSERIPCFLATGLASKYKIEIPYINPATKSGAEVLPKGIFNFSDEKKKAIIIIERESC